MRSGIRIAAAGFAAVALLFTQLAVSAFACPGESAASLSSPQSAMPGCHEMDGTAPPLCPAHCAQGQQSLDKPSAPVVAPAALIGYASWRAIEVTFELDDPVWRGARLIPPPEPPPTIRNCCLRI